MTLEQFIVESLKRSSEKKYHPTGFLQMVPKAFPSESARLGLIEAIRRCVESSEPKSGFRRMVDLDLKDWTLEAAVLRFPELFKPQAIAYAETRLKGGFNA